MVIELRLEALRLTTLEERRKGGTLSKYMLRVGLYKTNTHTSYKGTRPRWCLPSGTLSVLLHIRIRVYKIRVFFFFYFFIYMRASWRNVNKTYLF